MKNIIKIASLVLIISMMAVLLVSCGDTLSGTYVNETSLLGIVTKTTMEFDGHTVKTTTEVAGVGTSVSSQYKVEDGKFYTWATDGNEEEATYVSFNSGKDDGGKYIEIGGVKLYKK